MARASVHMQSSATAAVPDPVQPEQPAAGLQIAGAMHAGSMQGQPLEASRARSADRGSTQGASAHAALPPGTTTEEQLQAAMRLEDQGLATPAAPRGTTEEKLQAAMRLEDQGRLEEEGAAFAAAGRPAEALDMWLHERAWGAALRVARAHLPAEVPAVQARMRAAGVEEASLAHLPAEVPAVQARMRAAGAEETSLAAACAAGQSADPSGPGAVEDRRGDGVAAAKAPDVGQGAAGAAAAPAAAATADELLEAGALPGFLLLCCGLLSTHIAETRGPNHVKQ